MKAGRQSKWRALLAVAALFAATQRAGAQQTNASGSLVLNGSRTLLKYAYAAAEPGFFDKAKEDIHVLLSDEPLADSDRSDTFRLIRLGRDNKAHIVEVVLNSEGNPISGAIYAEAFHGMLSVSGVHQFERRRLEPRLVEGRLHTDRVHDIAKVAYEYDATFTAVIPRPPTAEETAVALATPPAAAARDYLAAVIGGDLPAFLNTLDRSRAADYRGADGASRFAQLRAEMPKDARVTSLTRQSEAAATATIEGHDNGIAVEYLLKLVVEAGVWRIGK